MEAWTDLWVFIGTVQMFHVFPLTVPFNVGLFLSHV